MNLTEHILTQNDCYKANRTIIPQGIMVHSTGVAQPNVNVFLDTWNRSGYPDCVHAFVHEGGAVQTLPWNWHGWHAGTGTTGRSANNTHISFEICEPAGHTYDGGVMVGYDADKNAAYFAAVYQNAVELCVMLCKKYGFDPTADGVLICHSEGHTRGIASNHADVMQWLPKHGKSMDNLRGDVAARLKGGDGMTETEIRALIDAELDARAQKSLYVTLEELPDWGRPTVERMVAAGVLLGNERGELNLTVEILRCLVVIERVQSASAD